ncbi:MAG: histidine kinase, partial [Actinomycetota bacterium]
MRALVDAVTASTRVQDDPEQMREQIVEAARTVSGAEYAALGIVGPDGRTLDAFLHTGMDPATV